MRQDQVSESPTFQEQLLRSYNFIPGLQPPRLAGDPWLVVELPGGAFRGVFPRGEAEVQAEDDLPTG